MRLIIERDDRARPTQRSGGESKETQGLSGGETWIWLSMEEGDRERSRCEWRPTGVRGRVRMRLAVDEWHADLTSSGREDVDDRK
ncbi:hypothetical protein SLA2020_080440 [Shorea laevis]